MMAGQHTFADERRLGGGRAPLIGGAAHILAGVAGERPVQVQHDEAEVVQEVNPATSPFVSNSR